jgi:hypothetical protein
MDKQTDPTWREHFHASSQPRFRPPFRTLRRRFRQGAQGGNITPQLLPPPGYCEMDRSSGPSDIKMIDAVDGMLKPTGNRLLAISADCTQLRRRRW